MTDGITPNMVPTLERFICRLTTADESRSLRSLSEYLSRFNLNLGDLAKAIVVNPTAASEKEAPDAQRAAAGRVRVLYDTVQPFSVPPITWQSICNFRKVVDTGKRFNANQIAMINRLYEKYVAESDDDMPATISLAQEMAAKRVEACIERGWRRLTPREREFCLGAEETLKAGHPLTEDQIKKLDRIYKDRIHYPEHRRG